LHFHFYCLHFAGIYLQIGIWLLEFTR